MPDVDITITIPAAQVQRVRNAFTAMLPGLKGPATAADVKAYLIAKVRELVQNAERQAAQRAAADSIADPPDLT